MAPEVFGVGVTSLRQEGIEPFVVIAMNPPDEEHWTVQLKSRIDELRPAHPRLKMDVEIFTIPPGENPHISDDQRQRNQAALEAIGRGDLVSRLVKGIPGFIVLGEPVMPEYSDWHHVSEMLLQPLRNREVIRLWDFGLTPTCVWRGWL